MFYSFWERKMIFFWCVITPTCLFNSSFITARVKFPHSPILHHAFSSWIEKTMTKTTHYHWGDIICFTIVGGCAEILPKILLLLHFTNLCSVLTGDTLSWSSFRQVSKRLLSSEMLSNAAMAKQIDSLPQRIHNVKSFEDWKARHFWSERYNDTGLHGLPLRKWSRFSRHNYSDITASDFVDCIKVRCNSRV